MLWTVHALAVHCNYMCTIKRQSAPMLQRRFALVPCRLPAHQVHHHYVPQRRKPPQYLDSRTAQVKQVTPTLTSRLSAALRNSKSTK